MRPTDWSALGLGGDPVPGDPAHMRRAATQVSTMADVAATASTDLGSVVGQVGATVWAGASGDQFRSTVGEQFRPVMTLVSESLGGAATALSTWANDVEDAQRTADHLLSQAVSASDDIASASGALSNIANAIDRAQRDVDAAEPGSAAATAAAKRLTDAQASQSGTSATVISAQRRIDSAIASVAVVVDDYANSAKKAAAALRKSTEDTQPPKAQPAPEPAKKPGFWEKVGDGALDVVSTVGNGVASFGNAMVEHPGETATLIGGLLTMAGGEAIEGGGVALDATGVGAIGGVPLNIIGAGVIGAGATATTVAGSSLAQHAMSDSSTSPFDTGRLERSGSEPNPKYPGRDTAGKYRSETNNKPDLDNEKAGLDEIEQQTGAKIDRTKVIAHVKGGTPGGRYYDGLIKNSDGTYTGVEVKSNGADLSATQKINDGLVSAKNPAIARLNGEEIKITRVILKRYVPNE
ncbi:hypothetical protein BH11ACT2_BH11ACT2_03880 [soil metagenome]